MLPVRPEPAGTAPAPGVAVAENEIVLPLTVMLLPARPVADTVAAKASDAAAGVLARPVEAEIGAAEVLLFSTAPNAVDPPTPPILAVAPAAVAPPAAPV